MSFAEKETFRLPKPPIFRAPVSAIKHRSCKLKLSCENEESVERLNIDGECLDTPSVHIRLSIWDDGEIYYRTCQSQKVGWKHKVELVGDISNLEAAEKVEILFEAGLHMKDEMELLELWKAALPRLK